MSTRKQQQASRVNGSKSKGPTSPEGKARSSQNALTHGLYAEAPAITGEESEAYQSLADRYFDLYHPVGPIEQRIVVNLVRNDWLLRRLDRTEVDLWEKEIASAPEPGAALGHAMSTGHANFSLLQRRLDSAERNYARALNQLRLLQDWGRRRGENENEGTNPNPPTQPASHPHLRSTAEEPPSQPGEPRRTHKDLLALFRSIR